MAIKATMFFEMDVGDTPYGWTESHYDLQSGDLKTALVALQKLAAKRAALCGGGVRMPKIRVSDPNVFRDSQIGPGPKSDFSLDVKPIAGQLNIQRVVPGTGNTEEFQGPSKLRPFVDDVPKPINIQYLSTMPFNGVLIRMEGGTTFQSRKALILRGIPDGVISILYTGASLNTTSMGAAWESELQTGYMKLLLSGQWGFQGVDMSGANPARVPAAIVITAGGVLTMTATANQPAVNQNLRIRGVKILGPNGDISSKVNRLWTCMTSVGNVSTFINGSNFPAGVYTTLNLGNYRFQTPAYIAYNNDVDIRYTKRNTGRPFFLPRGRARAPARR